MAVPLEFGATRQAPPFAGFSMRRSVYVPLMLSLTVSLPLTSAALIATAAASSGATGDARLADALALFPQMFVICVSACWLAFGLFVPRSRQWYNRDSMPTRDEGAL
jgi:hypothetical protein